MTKPITDYPPDWDVHNLVPSKENQVIVNASSGTTPRTSNLDFWGGTIPWLTPKEITGRNTFKHRFTTKRFLSKNGAKKAGKIYPIDTVMLSKRAPVGHVVINKTPMCTNQGFLNFTCGEKIIPEFLLYWLKANTPYLERVANGSTFDELYGYDLYELQIGIPSIEEQEKIIKTLSVLDDKIDINLKLIKTLHSSLFSIYKKLTSNNDLNSEITKKDTVKEKFQIVGSVKKGFGYRGIEKSDTPTDYFFVTLNSVIEGGGFKTKYSWIQSSRLKEKHFINELDLVIANTEQTKDARLLATPALVIKPYFYEKESGVYSHHISKIVAKKENVKFFLYFLFLDKHEEIANSYHTGTGVWGFDYENFEKQFEIILPSKTSLIFFEKMSLGIFKKIVSLEKQIMMLEDMKKMLEIKLVYGKIRLK
jgi:YD repeat-containing protein